MTKLTKWLIAAGLIIVLVGGFFAGFYYQKIKSRLSASADVVTGNSPLTASQQTNENQVLQQAFQNAWTDYVKAKSMPGQGQTVSLNNLNLQKYLGIKPAYASSNYKNCTRFETDIFLQDFFNAMQNAKIQWGNCEIYRSYDLDGSLLIDHNRDRRTGQDIYKITFTGVRIMENTYRDSNLCKNYKLNPLKQSFSYTFYTNEMGGVLVTVPPVLGSWQAYCSTPIEAITWNMNPDIDKTCPCKSTPAPTSTPTPTPPPTP